MFDIPEKLSKAVGAEVVLVRVEQVELRGDELDAVAAAWADQFISEAALRGVSALVPENFREVFIRYVRWLLKMRVRQVRLEGLPREHRAEQLFIPAPIWKLLAQIGPVEVEGLRVEVSTTPVTEEEDQARSFVTEWNQRWHRTVRTFVSFATLLPKDVTGSPVMLLWLGERTGSEVTIYGAVPGVVKPVHVLLAAISGLRKGPRPSTGVMYSVLLTPSSYLEYAAVGLGD